MKSLSDRMNALSPCEVRVHDNARTYLRTEKRGAVLILHMHQFFCEAPTPVLEAVLSFAKRKNKDALRTIRQMAELYFAENKAEPVELNRRPQVYPLHEIMERIRDKYFSPDYNPSIGWSNRTPRGKFCSITFGSYDRHRNQIRINPILDHRQVPLSFVEFVVYHEMLHGVCPPIIDSNGRTLVHTREFRAKEKQFEKFQEAKEWEKTSAIPFFKKLRKEHGRT